MEDVLFNAKLMTHSPKYLLIDDVVYNYYDNPGSLLNKADKNKAVKLKKLLVNFYHYLTVSDKDGVGMDLFSMLLPRYLCWTGLEAAMTEDKEDVIACIRLFGDDPVIRETLDNSSIWDNLSNLSRWEDRILYCHAIK